MRAGRRFLLRYLGERPHKPGQVRFNQADRGNPGRRNGKYERDGADWGPLASVDQGAAARGGGRGPDPGPGRAAAGLRVWNKSAQRRLGAFTEELPVQLDDEMVVRAGVAPFVPEGRGPVRRTISSLRAIISCC